MGSELGGSGLYECEHVKKKEARDLKEGSKSWWVANAKQDAGGAFAQRGLSYGQESLIG